VSAGRVFEANHGGEYARLFGIDTKAKRRVLEITIQNLDGGGFFQSLARVGVLPLLPIPAVPAVLSPQQALGVQRL